MLSLHLEVTTHLMEIEMHTTLRRALSLLVCTSALALAAPAMAAPTSCDTLAASPHDLTRAAGVPGVTFDAIDVIAALPACEAAFAADPTPRNAFQLGRVIYASGDYASAKTMLQQAADAGHDAARISLAQLHVDLASAEALALTEAAAAGGNVTALYNLGVIYQFGQGTEPDVQRAIDYYAQAAALGDAEAEYNLGVIYDEGTLVLRDLELARQHYEVAAAADHGWAKVNLAYLLLETGADADRAADLFRSSYEDDGDINSGLQLGILLQDGDAAAQAESKTLILTALAAHDLELGAFLLAPETTISTANIKAIQETLGVAPTGTIDRDFESAVRTHYAAAGM